jgi:hypothetical protein
MEPFFSSLAQREFAFPAALALLALAVVVLARLHARAQRRWGVLLTGAEGVTLESLLERHLVERAGLQAEIESLSARVRRMEEEAQSALRHVGLVRFDAFDDVGGEMSFALAAMDDRGDGAVLTSIVGRESCRVYAKRLIAGRGERELSGEERRAVRAAVESGPRAAVNA